MCPEEQRTKKLLTYGKWYLENLDYLKEIKSTFDKWIYLPLSHTYYDEDDPRLLPSHNSPPSINGSVTSLRSGRPSSKSLSRSNSILMFKEDIPDIKDLYDYSDLDNVTGRLSYLRERLGHLLEDQGELNPDLFSLNSEKYTKGYPEKLHNLIRLVPDILLKCRKAAALAQQWLAIEAAKEMDTQQKLLKLERVETVLSEKLEGVSQELVVTETELAQETYELQSLLEREDRALTIHSETREIDLKIEEIQGKIERIDLEIEDVNELVKTVKSNKQFFDQLSKDLVRKHLEKEKLLKRITTLQFERNILTEDYSFELEIKPSIIRYTNDTQDKCEKLEQEVEFKRNIKDEIENALIPIKEDTIRMKSELSDQTETKSRLREATYEK